MEEDYNGRFERINGFWPQVDQQSQRSDLCWNQNQNQMTCINSKLTDLYRSKQRFKEFIEQIAQIKKTPIREDILKYCETQGKKQKNIQVHYKPQTILKKIQIRIQKMIKTKRIKRNWGQQDIKILLWIISKYSDWKCYNNIEKQINQQDWKFISTLIPGVNPQICMFKWLSLKKITLSTNSWSDYQSNLLSSIVQERNNKGFKHNSQIHDWKQISQQLYLLNNTQNKVYRNAKQCRQHWTCYLSPQLKKGPWQLYQDVRLLKFIKSNNGLKKWSQISRYFEGRTENALKNRYTLIIDKQKKQSKNKHKNQLQLVNQYLQKCYIEQFTSEKQQDHMIYEEESEENKAKKQSKSNNNYDKYGGNSKINKKNLQKESHHNSNMFPNTRQTQQKLFTLIPNHSNSYPALQRSISSFNHCQPSSCQPMIKKQQNFQQIFQQDHSSINPYQQQQNFTLSHQNHDHNYTYVDKYQQSLNQSSDENNGNISSSLQTRPITPIKDFEKIGMQNFLKFIQPGIMDSSGKFKKVQKYVGGNEEWKASCGMKKTMVANK